MYYPYYYHLYNQNLPCPKPYYTSAVPSKVTPTIRYFHPGDPAPDFTLEGVENLELKLFRLKDYLGKWVLLFFYGSNFTYV